MTDWTPWFAWYPVRCVGPDGLRWVWIDMVHRMRWGDAWLYRVPGGKRDVAPCPSGPNGERCAWVAGVKHARHRAWIAKAWVTW